MSIVKVRVDLVFDTDDRAALAHNLGNHKSGIRGHHRLATREELRNHVRATVEGDFDEMRSYLADCQEVPA